MVMTGVAPNAISGKGKTKLLEMGTQNAHFASKLLPDRSAHRRLSVEITACSKLLKQVLGVANRNQGGPLLSK